eukprot:jgi/Mesvir1/29096/Mv18402-RA.1
MRTAWGLGLWGQTVGTALRSLSGALCEQQEIVRLTFRLASRPHIVAVLCNGGLLFQAHFEGNASLELSAEYAGVDLDSVVKRSPCAEGLFKHLLPKLANCSMPVVDSCGIGGHFAGSPPATKMQKAALDHGFDISGLRARQVHAEDFDKFDLIVAMDRENLEDLRRVCPPSHSYKLKLLLAYAPEGTTLEIIAKAMERLIRSEYHAFLKPPS